MTNINLKNFSIECAVCHSPNCIINYYFEQWKVRFLCRTCTHEETLDFSPDKKVNEDFERNRKVTKKTEEKKKINIRNVTRETAKKYGVTESVVSAYLKSVVEKSTIQP